MRYVFLLLAMLTLSACSYTPETLRNAYHNLGKDYARELKQMSSFTAQEQAQIDDFGTQIQQWHKQQKLPGYANTMQGLATALKTQGAIPRNQLANFMDLLEGYPHFNEARAVNLHLAELARQLKEPQYAQIAAQLREERADQEEFLQALSPQKLLRQRVKAVNNFAAFVGVELTRNNWRWWNAILPTCRISVPMPSPPTGNGRKACLPCWKSATNPTSPRNSPATCWMTTTPDACGNMRLPPRRKAVSACWPCWKTSSPA